MKPIGNAMTANLGDENDDGVCEHEEWHIVGEQDSVHLRSLQGVLIKCENCGADGWLTIPVIEDEVEWTT